MSNTDLELAISAFKAWRAERKNRAEKIPEKLWSIALSLYPKYKRSHICQQLRISGSCFKKRIEPNALSSKKDGFVLAKTNPIYGETKKHECSETVLLSLHGQLRKLTIQVNLNALNHLLPQLDKLL